MITFLLYTIIAWLANACLAKILFISIQAGQWIDKLFNWQNRLYNWDLTGQEFLAKAGGLCELCFSHFITFLSFWSYLFFMQHVLGYWVTTPVESVPAAWLINIIWYLVYVAVGTNLSLYFIHKLFQA